MAPNASCVDSWRILWMKKKQQRLQRVIVWFMMIRVKDACPFSYFNFWGPLLFVNHHQNCRQLWKKKRQNIPMHNYKHEELFSLFANYFNLQRPTCPISSTLPLTSLLLRGWDCSLPSSYYLLLNNPYYSHFLKN